MFEEAPQGQQSSETGTPRWIGISIVLIVAAVAALSFLGYRVQERLNTGLHDQNAVLERLRQDQNARFNALQAQLEATGRKVGVTQKDLSATKHRAEEIRKEQEEAAAKLNDQITTVAKDSNEKIGSVAASVDATNQTFTKSTAEINTKLESMKGDEGVMSGLIAKNQGDLETLRMRGERNYYEFTLTKAKQPSKVGPVRLLLKSSDSKRNRYTVSVLVDDRTIEKRDKTAGEPVQFYVAGGKAYLPYEIVVFTVAKASITGYLSTPKVESGRAAN